eukprot:COSAG01_NODE_76258_length_188_cov_17.258427_1_plen_33_part_01
MECADGRACGLATLTCAGRRNEHAALGVAAEDS